MPTVASRVFSHGPAEVNEDAAPGAPLWWILAVPGLLVLTAGLLWAGSPATMITVLWLLGAVCVALMAPLRWGPAVGLLGYAAVPVNYLVIPGSLQLVSPLVAALAVWSVRTAVSRRSLLPQREVLAGAVLLGGWLGLITLVTSTDQEGSLRWSLAFGLGVLLPVAAGRAVPGMSRLVVSTSLMITATLSLYALAEAVARTNAPLHRVYEDFGLTQVWAVYRVTTTLGHPLANSLLFGTFFALLFTTAVLRANLLLSLGALAALAAATLTGSFSSTIVCAVGGGVALTGMAIRRDVTWRRLPQRGWRWASRWQRSPQRP